VLRPCWSSSLITPQEIALAISRFTRGRGAADALPGCGECANGRDDGVTPYQVIARFHRKYIDANRSAHKASCTLHLPDPAYLLSSCFFRPRFTINALLQLACTRITTAASRGPSQRCSSGGPCAGAVRIRVVIPAATADVHFAGPSYWTSTVLSSE
jgi:hypothetical protein